MESPCAMSRSPPAVDRRADPRSEELGFKACFGPRLGLSSRAEPGPQIAGELI
jgi:hypothetical protein